MEEAALHSAHANGMDEWINLFNIHAIFYSHCSHQHVLAGIPAIFRAMLSWSEYKTYKCGDTTNHICTFCILVIKTTSQLQSAVLITRTQNVQMWLVVSPHLYILYSDQDNITLKMAGIPTKTCWWKQCE